jgi:tetratricopeptide (TPR) repeat protein
VQRPSWSSWLDAAASLSSRLLGRLLPRPTEAQLMTLAGRQPGASPSSPALAAAEHIAQGRKALEAAAFGEALHHFGEALSLHPEARWAWHGRGDALQLSGEHAAAQRAYERAIHIDPECGLHHAGQANALGAQAQPDAARAAWATALGLDPTLEWMREG